ncbi:hypothetical protein [Pseudomonas helleri]|mgnify:CR=1 FL=1|uniref:hypothetical protein n=1 Tax=Pseudomonas helleri TaxID=1608996 RepID=UPI00242ECFA3|nr:hypothetical protein [Pseudomonas helleri]
MPNRKANLVKPSKSRDRQGLQGIQQKTNLPNLFPVGQHEMLRTPMVWALAEVHLLFVRAKTQTAPNTAPN